MVWKSVDTVDTEDGVKVLQQKYRQYTASDADSRLLEEHRLVPIEEVL